MGLIAWLMRRLKGIRGPQVRREDTGEMALVEALEQYHNVAISRDLWRRMAGELTATIDQLESTVKERECTIELLGADYDRAIREVHDLRGQLNDAEVRLRLAGSISMPRIVPAEAVTDTPWSTLTEGR